MTAPTRQLFSGIDRYSFAGAKARQDAVLGGILKKMFGLIVVVFAGSVFAGDVWVAPHLRADGTFVQGHYQTAPDHNVQNNYSTQGNVNPYTGQPGNVNPYSGQRGPVVPQFQPPIYSTMPMNYQQYMDAMKEREKAGRPTNCISVVPNSC